MRLPANRQSPARSDAMLMVMSLVGWSREELELPAIAHGPAILARSTGLVIGLRDIVAYSTGLQISVVALATGVHAEAAARQFRAPAEIDPIT